MLRHMFWCRGDVWTIVLCRCGFGWSRRHWVLWRNGGIFGTMRHHLTNNAYTSNEEIMVEKCEKSSFPFEAVHPHINICILLMKGMLIRALSLDFVIWLSKELHKYLLWTCSGRNLLSRTLLLLKEWASYFNYSTSCSCYCAEPCGRQNVKMIGSSKWNRVYAQY